MRALRRILSLALTTSLLFQQIGFAQIATELNIASHLSRMASSLAIDKFRPLHLRYFSYDPDSNNFKFLFDKGDLKQLEDAKFKEESSELLKYFLIGITLPDSKFWVNLRPDSSDQIIEPELEQTDLGKVLLEADLQLKKDTARYTSPETPEGKEYWNKLYKKAEELFGLENVTIPTLTRPWIVPGEIIVRETQESAFIYKSTLKVMLEQDYIKESSSPLAAAYSFKDPRQKILNEYSSQVIRELIIPKLTKEVNTSKKYAALRQVFYSLILSRWFKARYASKKELSPKLVPEGEGTVPFYVNLIDSKNLNGLTSKESWSKTTYFEQYKKSFADGEYNLKEQVYTPTGQVIRSYFSGGIEATAPATTYSGIGAIGEQGFSTLSANKNFAAVTFTKTGPSDGAVLAPIISLQGEIEKVQKPSSSSPITIEALKRELITKGLNSEIMDKLLKAVKKPVILGQNAFSVSVGESRVRFFLLEVSERKSSHYPFYSIIFGGAKGEMLSIAVPVSGKMDAIEIGARKFDINALTLVSDIADNIMKALNSAAGSPLQKDPIYDALRKRLAYIETYFALLDDGVKELAGDFGPNVFRPLVDDDMEKGQKKIPGMIKQRGETILDGPQVYESLGLVVSTNDKKEIIAVVKRFSNLFTVPLDDSEGILQRLSQNMDEEIADTAKAAIERMKDRQDEIVKLTAGSPISAIKKDLGRHKLTLMDIKVRRTGLSNGGQTIEYNFYFETKGGFRFPAPITGETAAGASAGDREAFFLYDGDFAKKNPELLTDEMIKDLYPGEKVSKEEAIKRMKEDFKGKGVRVAQRIAEKIIIPRLINTIQTGKVDLMERYSVDRFLLDLEEELGGNKRQKLMLTGNNTTALTVAAAKVGAMLNGISVRDFLSYRKDPKSIKIDPNQYGEIFPLAVLIEGGAHADFNTDWQEYMVKVYGKNYADKIRKLNKISEALSKIIRKEYKVPASVGMESAFTPPVKSNVEPIELIQRAVVAAGFTLGIDATIGLDLASSEFWGIGGEDYYYHRVEGRYSAFDSKPKLQDGKHLGRFKDVKGDDGKIKRYLALTTDEMFDWFKDLITNKKYYISSVEDIFHQNDKKGNKLMTKLVQSKEFINSLPHEFQRRDGVVHVADDFSTTHIDVIKAGIRLEGTQVTYDQETRQYAMVKSEIEEGRVILGLSKEAHELIVEAGSIDGVLLKLNQAGTIMEYMAAVEVLRFFGRTIVHSHRGGEPSKEDIRADVALASTTYPLNPHNITGKMPTIQLKYAQYIKERTIVHDAIIRAEEEIAAGSLITAEEIWNIIYKHQKMGKIELTPDAISEIKRRLLEKDVPISEVQKLLKENNRYLNEFWLVENSLPQDPFSLQVGRVLSEVLDEKNKQAASGFPVTTPEVSSPIKTGGIDDSTSSPSISAKKTGGIDFRVMNIVTQPLVASSSLNLKLPQSANLARINLDEELKQMKNMLAAKIAPSGERFKEVMASSALKGEWDRRIPEIISCLVDVCRLEEDNLSETPLGIKEALIIADSANF